MIRPGLCALLCWTCWVVRPVAAEPPSPKPDAPPPTVAYPLPRHALARFGSLVLRHGDDAHPAYATALLWLADSRTMITAASDNHLYIWDAATGRQLHRLLDQGFEPRCLSATADGKLLASWGDDKAIHLTDPATGNEQRRIPFPDDQATILVFSPNGKRLASASLDHHLRIWDTATGKEVWSLHDKDYRALALAIAPGGEVLASGDSDGKLHLRDMATGKPRRSWQGPDQWVDRLCFSPDGKLLATAARDGGVRVWDPEKGKHVLSLPELRTNYTNLDDLTFSPDGRLLFASTPAKGGLWVWKVPSGEKMYDILKPSKPPRHPAFSPDGKTLAAIHENQVLFWNVATGKALTGEEGHTSNVAAVACTPDGKRVVTASSDCTVRVWDAATGLEQQRFLHNGQTFTCLAIAPDGKTVAAGTHKAVARWELASGKALPALPTPEGWIRRLAFSPDGKVLAAGGTDKLVRFWDPQTGKESQLSQQIDEPVRALTFAPDGRTLAVAAGTGDAVLLADVTGVAPDRTLKCPRRAMFCLATSPDGRLVAAGNNEGFVCVWEACTGQELYNFQAHKYLVESLAFSPDGLVLASGGRESGMGEDEKGNVRLWNAATGKRLEEFTGHRHWVNSVAFTPDGNALVSGGFDHQVLLWDTSERVAPRRPPYPAPAAGEAKRLLTVLGGVDAVAAQRAIWQLAAVPKESVPLIRERLDRLRDKPRVDQAAVERLLAELDSDDFAVRDRAGAELEKLGDQAEPALRKVLEDKPSVEVRSRVTKLLSKFGDPRTRPDGIWSLRALAVLERANTSEAREAVEGLASAKSADWLTREAEAVWRRMDRKTER
jgi:WD40 repeat protein